ARSHQRVAATDGRLLEGSSGSRRSGYVREQPPSSRRLRRPKLSLGVGQTTRVLAEEAMVSQVCRRLRRPPARSVLAVLLFGAGAWRGPSLVRADPKPRCRVRGSHEWLASRASPLDSASVVDGSDVAFLCFS